jgi:hypothetical protein
VTTFFGGDHALKTIPHGGVIALQRVGDSNIAVFGAVEGTAMTDESRTVTAKGGVRAF